MPQKPEKKNKKANPLLRLVLALCVVYFAFSLVGGQLELRNRREELAGLQQKLEDQRIANKETERLISMNEDETYIERIAKDRLGYAFPDERVFIDFSGTK